MGSITGRVVAVLSLERGVAGKRVGHRTPDGREKVSGKPGRVHFKRKEIRIREGASKDGVRNGMATGLGYSPNGNRRVAKFRALEERKAPVCLITLS